MKSSFIGMKGVREYYSKRVCGWVEIKFPSWAFVRTLYWFSFFFTTFNKGKRRSFLIWTVYKIKVSIKMNVQVRNVGNVKLSFHLFHYYFFFSSLSLSLFSTLDFFSNFFFPRRVLLTDTVMVTRSLSFCEKKFLFFRLVIFLRLLKLTGRPTPLNGAIQYFYA